MSTATAPIRFRCFRCQKLLGVSKSKAGAVVACPQCSAELIVPESAETMEPNSSTPPKSSSSSQIEPVVVPWDAHPEPEGAVSVADVAFPAVQIGPVSLRTEPPSRRAARPSSSTPVSVSVADFSNVATAPSSRVEAPSEATVLPELAMETPSLRESGPARVKSPSAARLPRRDDVIMPRSALILWSFLVLIGFVFAFTTGLLIGRFLWATGIPTKVPASPTVSAVFETDSSVLAREPDCILLRAKV